MKLMKLHILLYIEIILIYQYLGAEAKMQKDVNDSKNLRAPYDTKTFVSLNCANRHCTKCYNEGKTCIECDDGYILHQDTCLGNYND